jgi:hypothetical protein
VPVPNFRPAGGVYAGGLSLRIVEEAEREVVS